MNQTWRTKLPLSQVNNLLSEEGSYRQSVVFLESSYVANPGYTTPMQAGDFLFIVSDTTEGDFAPDYVRGLLLVTNLLSGIDGIEGRHVAASVRPLTEDEEETCDECGGEGYYREEHGPEEGGGGTEYLGCEKCDGYGKVAIHA